MLVELLSFLEVKPSAAKRVLVAFHIPERLRDVLSGITRYAREQHRNWQILCVNADEFKANFSRNRCDGAIVQIRPENRRLLDRVLRSSTPAVDLLRDLSPKIPSVLSDDAAIGRLGATYLTGLGFKKLAFVPLETPWSRNRLAGFTAALMEANLPPPITTESFGVKDFRFDSKLGALKLLGRWARALGPRCAVMAPSDFVARTLFSAVQAAGLHVPDEIAILGVDNFPTLSQLCPVPISSIAQDFPAMGFQAARLLDELMQHRKQSGAPVLIPPGRLHVRASTNVLAFEDPLIVDALRAIHENPAKGIEMNELLRRIPLSRKWLDHRFKLAVGHTPAEEIRRCRLRAVRDLLIDTTLPLRQIASRCGFHFPENMIRSFRDGYGMSPSAYRARHRSTPG